MWLRFGTRRYCTRYSCSSTVFEYRVEPRVVVCAISKQRVLCAHTLKEDVADIDLHHASAGEEAMGASPSVRPASGMDGCSAADVRVRDTAA